MRCFYLFIMTLFGLALFSGKGHAQDLAETSTINNSGAVKLRIAFEDLIAKHAKNLQASQKGVKLIAEGKTLVEPYQTYYAVTLPYLKLLYDDGRRLEFGMISINAAPYENAQDQWKMTFALPTPIIMYDAKNNQIARIFLGPQRNAGLWDQALGQFIKLDAQFKDVSVESAFPNLHLKAAHIAMRHDFTKTPKDLLSGPATLSAKNIDVSIPKTNEIYNIGTLESVMDIDNSQVDFTNIEFKFSANTISAPDTNPYKNITPQSTQAHINFKNMPLMQLIQTVDKTLNQPAMNNLGHVALMLQLPSILGQSSASLDIQEANITGQDYSFALEGHAKADQAAALGFTAQASGNFKGLDTLIKKVEAIEDKNKIDVLDQLNTIKKYSTAVTIESTPDLYTSNFIVNSQGQILLNNKDLLQNFIAKQKE